MRTIRWLIKLFYLPFVLLAGNGIAIYLVGSGYSDVWLALLLSGFVGLSFICEKIVPYDPTFNLSQQDKCTDFIHAIVNESLNIFGILMLPLVGQAFALVDLWPSSLPLPLQLGMAILIADMGITLAHFASHRFHSLWQLHAVHHSAKRLYGFNGLMKHPLHQLIETVAGTMPLLLIGVSHDVMLLLVVAVVLQLLLQHSNVAYSSGPLKYILAINSVHRFHHLNTAKEGDVNFGLFTTLTDRFLGTAYFDPSRQIVTEDLGISSEPDYPKHYVDQLHHPFQQQNSKRLVD